MATWSNLNFQDSSSPIMEQMIFFHDFTLMILTLIIIFISYLMTALFFNKLTNRLLLEEQMIELIWTILPAVILIFIALPSLKLLYLIDENNKPAITLKTTGHQWFWSYEYSDFKKIKFDSFMVPTNDMTSANFRLIEVDNRIIIPLKTKIRILITANDVIHSWTIPALGVKADATPGRLNQANFLINRPGLFFGQCSEICGTNHSFMPITIESVTPKLFINWIKTQ
uniref:Cytochrome c oxidase subunit 2 n=1 Tax=Pseudopotamorites peniculus TaxID=2904919 RepID=A0A9E8LP95_9NEOP|nr:cytochrome c oxidase subunit II [Pseudopotamorites peniculus]UZZ44301.1 cytochrome c oxidase subunit II [Pseudopotamorites peniculus]